MFNKFTEEAKKVLSLSKQEMIELKHPYLGSEHLMLGILKKENSISNLFKKYNITYKKYKEAVINFIGIGKEETKWILYTPIVKEIFERAIDISDENGNQVNTENLFIALIEIGDGIANRVLKNLQVDMDKIYTELIFKIPKKSKKKKTIIDEVGVEFTTSNMVATFDPVIGRDSEIKQIIEILIRKNKSNPLLIGEAGVGKTAIIEEISKMIVNNKVPNKLKNKRIINLDMSSAVAGTKYRGEFEDKLNKIIKEAETNSDIILFIDEIHTIVGAGGAEGAIDASNIFKPALARGNIKCIGATTLDEYKKFIEKDKALERRFKKVIVEEPSMEQTRDIIYKIKPIYENYHHVSINCKLLELIIELTNKYIHTHKNPDKTIDILDEVCAHANLKDNVNVLEYDRLSGELSKIIDEKKKKILNNDFKTALEFKHKENEIVSRLNELELLLATTHYNKVTQKDIFEVLKNKVNMPIFELDKRHNKQNLIKKLQSIVLGQDAQIEQLVSDYFTYNKSSSCVSFLLSGPSGVGKTLLANEFGKAISNKILKIDMSEYSEQHSVSKLVGAPPGYVGYDDSNYILDNIRQYPFTVIILDEIEKAHPSVMNIFYQILDDSKIKDSKGNDIYFNNVVIIMTTNIEQGGKVGFKHGSANKPLNDYFNNSFLNRISEVINMRELDKTDIVNIIKKYSKCKINDNKTITKILDKSMYEKYGARQIENLIKKYIDSKKVKKMVKNYSKN